MNLRKVISLNDLRKNTEINLKRLRELQISMMQNAEFLITQIVLSANMEIDMVDRENLDIKDMSIIAQKLYNNAELDIHSREFYDLLNDCLGKSETYVPVIEGIKGDDSVKGGSQVPTLGVETETEQETKPEVETEIEQETTTENEAETEEEKTKKVRMRHYFIADEIDLYDEGKYAGTIEVKVKFPYKGQKRRKQDAEKEM